MTAVIATANHRISPLKELFLSNQYENAVIIIDSKFHDREANTNRGF